MKHVLIGTALAATAVTGATAQEVTLGRFFGACEDAGTDTTASTGEACIIQSIINAADAELDDITVNTLPTDWGNYYDQIIAAYAGGEPPDVHVMHRHRVPQFAGLGALAELSGDLEAAGLVAEDGSPILPSSPEELLEHAAMVEEATGQDYLAADFAQFPIGVRLVLSLMWQQGENIFTEDGTATIDTEAARNAVTTITQLFDAGHADPQLNYADSQQAFLNGEAAVLVNGTWVVDFYSAEAANPDVALSDYYVADFPTLFAEGATWADSHMWAIPASLQRDDPETYAAALQVLAFINAHNIDWARTGHMAVRNSVLASEAYAALPHRDEYTGTASIARDTPAAENYGAIQDVLNRELQAIWLTGKPVGDALSDAELEVQDLLDG